MAGPENKGSNYIKIYLHLVWATWDRLSLISPDIETAIYAAMHKKAKELRCPLLATGGMPDHVHVLCELHSTVPVAQLVKGLRGNSSHLVTHALRPGDFFKWQGGYAAISVDPKGIRRVQDYIIHQKQHHKEDGLIGEWELEGT